MHARGDLHRAGVATRAALSPVERLEIALHPWVAFVVMPRKPAGSLTGKATS
jgi:NhaA family Na+:H+ antiporter